MARKVLPSKLISERILVEFDFLDQLKWGEALQSATVEVVVEIGVDALPQEMLYKVPVIVDGRFVHQQIFRGTPGVLYQVKCVALGDTFEPYEQVVRLAILPDTAQVPLFNATYLTSQPYPVEDTEGFQPYSLLQAAKLQGQLAASGEGFQSLFTVLSGQLFGSETSYTDWPPEGIFTEMIPLSGQLFGSSSSYNWPPGEGIDSAILMLQGTLVGGRVAYDSPSEGIYTQCVPLSGTLV
jgi:hypothetical protein